MRRTCVVLLVALLAAGCDSRFLVFGRGRWGEDRHWPVGVPFMQPYPYYYPNYYPYGYPYYYPYPYRVYAPQPVYVARPRVTCNPRRSSITIIPAAPGGPGPVVLPPRPVSCRPGAAGGLSAADLPAGPCAAGTPPQTYAPGPESHSSRSASPAATMRRGLDLEVASEMS